ncbi:hypothetical protein HNV11_20650 [Spirosoma taeanense]|uniref:Uncharacterized protein n=1 Tax=Spirosoma taeanense TaxID=2735870 RepID=A0A6M5YBX0_9BACT|nr:hypothetical protein [Spirosoma taeanense]QJW91617.1 hypothetical protein HNV11_20650 [Spirosoma taeanense]
MESKQLINSIDKGEKKHSKGKMRFSGQFGVIKKEKEEDDTVLISKSSGSGELLSKMITPQVFQVPNIQLQQKLVTKLEEALEEAIKHEKKSTIVQRLQVESCLGGIELTSLGEEDSLQEIIKKAKLIPIKGKVDGLMADTEGSANLLSTFDLVTKAGLADMIVENTLSTMEKANQLEYLRQSGLLNDKCKLVIEVHYIRDRNVSYSTLHKDTQGQTLFVNLNYLNKKGIAGPEFIVSPHSDEEDQERLRRLMPAKFHEDLQVARSLNTNLTKEGEILIETKDIDQEYGVVAFVDEGIHHMTPVIEHRTVTSKQIAEAYKDIKSKCDAYENRSVFYKLYSVQSYLSDLDNKYTVDAVGWLQIMSASLTTKYNRHDLKKLLPNLPDLEINKLIETGGYDQFGHASIPRFTTERKTVKKPVKKEGDPVVQRRMSMRLTGNNAPPKRAEGEKRAFFRTWVRVVRT